MNLLVLQIPTPKSVKTRRLLYMKATGIVRRMTTWTGLLLTRYIHY